MLATILALDLGYYLRIAAQSWLIFELTGQQLWVGLANAVRVVPIFAFSLFGGVISDRVDRRRVLASVRAGLGVLVLGAALLVLAGDIRPWHLVALNVGTGAVVSFGSPAFYALMFDLAGKARLWAANSMAAVVSNAGAIGGPIIAGEVLASTGAGAVYLVAAGLYFSGALGVLFITTPNAPAPAKSDVVQELAAGLRYVRATPHVAWALVVSVAAFAHSAVHPLLPVYARDVLGRGAAGYGLLTGSFGAGLFVGALFLSLLPDVKRKGLVVLVATVAWDAAMAAFGLSHNFAVSLVLVFVIGSAGAYLGNAVVTMLQQMSSDEMRGRVMSIFSITAEAGTLGWLAGGALAQATSNEVALVTMAAAGVAITVLAFAASPALRRA